MSNVYYLLNIVKGAFLYCSVETQDKWVLSLLKSIYFYKNEGGVGNVMHRINSYKCGAPPASNFIVVSQNFRNLMHL